LTPDQLQTALANLSLSDKQELLRLLQAREALEAEQVPDTRPTIADTFSGVRDEFARASNDAAAVQVAWDKHEAAAAEHFKKLEADRPLPVAWPGIAATMAWHAELYAESKALATADGYPDPCDAPRKPVEIDDDPLARMKRASLPKAIRDDLEETTARRAEAEAFRRAAREDAVFYRPAPAPASVEVVDKLDGFRGIGPVNFGPAYPDS
jgi:hypothetical protein